MNIPVLSSDFLKVYLKSSQSETLFQNSSIIWLNEVKIHCFQHFQPHRYMYDKKIQQSEKPTKIFEDSGISKLFSYQKKKKKDLICATIKYSWLWVGKCIRKPESIARTWTCNHLDQLVVLSTLLHKQFAYFPLNWPDALLSCKHNLNEIHRFPPKPYFS